MNTGRHFNPPTSAYRPQDPFSSSKPQSAELVPSCDAPLPPPARLRPVRIDPLELKVITPAPKAKAIPEPRPSVILPTTAKVFKVPVTKKAPVMVAVSQKVEKPAKIATPQLKEDEEMRKCEWVKCNKTFVAKTRGRNALRRFCSATCRGRASEARTGKR